MTISKEAGACAERTGLAIMRLVGKRMIRFLVMILLSLLSLRAESKDILISFDGSGHLAMWEKTLGFARDNHVKLTYFISAPYFITEAEEVASPYWAVKEIGKPLIVPRKASQETNIKLRFAYINQAVKEGNEIASHLCGHYDGSEWTYDQWMKEMGRFEWILSSGFDFKNIKGIRAPYLAVNMNYFRAARDSGYRYDSSLVDSPAHQNSCSYEKEISIRASKLIINENHAVKFPQVMLPFDCAFDDVCRIYHLNPANLEQEYFETLCYDYLHSPLPTQACLHFEQYEGDPYFKALERFVAWAKDKNPRYLTYSEYAKELFR